MTSRIPSEPVGPNELFLASVGDGLEILETYVFGKSEEEVVSWLKGLTDRELFVYTAGLATLGRMLERVTSAFGTEMGERGYDGGGLVYQGEEP